MTWTSNTLPTLANYATVTGSLTLLGGLAAIYHRHNCHEPRCPAIVRSGKIHCRRHEHANR